MTDIADIKLARLESSGDFSIIKISEKEPITRVDLLRLCQEAENDPLSIWGKQMVQWRRMAEQVEEIQKSIQNIEQDIMKKQPKKET